MNLRGHPAAAGFDTAVSFAHVLEHLTRGGVRIAADALVEERREFGFEFGMIAFDLQHIVGVAGDDPGGDRRQSSPSRRS